tara:strand:+ start:10862 stop:12133 length:1272 start_codon:yes stop_codon:yes gene_type:complete
MNNLFSEHINNDFDFLKKSKLLVCVSGGLDSMVLIDLLCKTKQDVSVAHCNFKLREQESDLDEEFVKKYCLKNSIPFFSKTFVTKIPKHSLQMAARTLRYDWFYDLLKKKKLNYILTAHHLDDSLETFILNLSRATGIKGLSGIKSINDFIARPLLIFSKDKILEYAKKNNIRWREDSSNIKNDYQRNQIRNKVIPQLKELHPDFLNQFNKTMNFLKDSSSIIKKYINIIKKENFLIKGEEIIISKKFINNNQQDVYELFKDYNFKNPKEILKLCNSVTGKMIESSTYFLLSDRSNLILKKNINKFNDVYEVGENGITTPLRINIEMGEFDREFNDNTIYLSKIDIDFPLFLRKWKKGDFIFPFGMNGKKMISKYYKDQKMSFFDKQSQWLLCNQEDVIWIVGKRGDKRYLKPNEGLIKIEVL